MGNNDVYFASPQFRLLSDRQIEELHLATLQILERTGIAFDRCQEALDILREAGADVSNPSRVKIPSYLVEQALRTAPKTITLYTREGEPTMVLNGQTGSHFGGVAGSPEVLDPYTGTRRIDYIEDIDNTARLIDALPNIEWTWTTSTHPTVPAAVADKMSFLHVVLNTSKPLACPVNDVSSLKEMLRVCSIIAGGEKELRDKPFFIGSSEPVTPLSQEKDAMEYSLWCAEKGIPIFVYSMPMAGATTPATWPAVLVMGTAEVLSQLVVLQLKNPGTPVIFGSMPNMMEMRTTIYPYGAPELSFLVAAQTEISHYYKLPMLGTAGCTDSDVIDAQTAIEVTYQILMSALSGADFVHDVGLIHWGRAISVELMVLCDEIIDMVNVSMSGIEINEETLPLDLIDRVGPRGTYISEKHTLKHFRKFWVPSIFDRSVVKGENTNRCLDLLKEKTIKILKTHQPKSLSEDLEKELKKVEESWFKKAGAEYMYPKRPWA
jgi:trimethylamine--corrinoid protein Co-methyltransferase